MDTRDKMERYTISWRPAKDEDEAEAMTVLEDELKHDGPDEDLAARITKHGGIVIDNKPEVQLSGRDGNAFAIIGACQRAARKAHWPTERWEAVRTKMMSGDYDNVLATAMEHFEVE